MKKILFLLPLLFIALYPQAFSEFIDSPRNQLESGIIPEDIICRDDRILAIRTNGEPACVTEKTAHKLNWEIIANKLHQIPTNIDNDDFDKTDKEIMSELHSSIPIKISDERVVTHSSSVQNQDIVSSIGYCPTNWPTYTIDTPSQVAIGEEFDVIIDYSYAIPDVDAGYEEPDEIFEPEKYPDFCLVNQIEIRTPSFVSILDQRYIKENVVERWDTAPPLLQNEGVIPYDFDNSGPQQEIITMRIDQPRFGDQLAEIYITPGHTIGVTRIAVTHDGVGEFIEVATKLSDWSVEDYSKYDATLKKIHSTFSIPETISINNQTWIDQNKRDLGYDPKPPQGNPPDVDEYASWLLQLPYSDNLRYYQVTINNFPQSFLDELFAAYPELSSASPTSLPDTKQTDEFVEFLLEHYPNENYREFLKNNNYSKEYIDHLFEKYPESITESNLLPWILLPAFAQTPPPSTFVGGNVISMDVNNNFYQVGNVKVCAFDENPDDGNPNTLEIQPLFNGITEICKITRASDGRFSFGVPTIDPEC